MSRKTILRRPDGLSPDAQQVWPDVVRRLGDTVGKADVVVLALFCEAYARWKVANEQVVKYGAVVKAPSGFPVQSPYLAVANKAHEQMVRLMVQLGMTPAARIKQQSEAQLGKKDQRAQRAREVGKGKFAPSAPPKLVVNNS